ncbi:MAG: hypothetical protein L6R42_008547, partial [Xanthoria sp. 1 TBL-2021]
DVDSDGKLDFEEFCVAMRIIFDLVNGEYPDVPATLPTWLVPSSKAHLITAASALRDHPSQSFPSPPTSPEEDGLKDNFDWYMSPTDKSKYDAIYTANKSRSGYLSFDSLEPLYSSLDVPDTDIRSAWNLVNPNAGEGIGKDAALAFLHILNNRHEGFRIPRSVPPSLRATFEQGKIDYQVDRVRSPAQRWGSARDDDTSTGRKTKFGDTYLSRLGVNKDSGIKGTDFSSVHQTRDWEEARLKRQLTDLEDKIAKIENSAKGRETRRREGRDTKPALVKRELESLLEYKRKELRELELGEGRSKEGRGVREVEGELKGLRELVEGLESHWRGRESVLEGLRREIEEAKRG